jgi:hypothetical protein
MTRLTIVTANGLIVHWVAIQTIVPTRALLGRRGLLLLWLLHLAASDLVHNKAKGKTWWCICACVCRNDRIHATFCMIGASTGWEC